MARFRSHVLNTPTVCLSLLLWASVIPASLGGPAPRPIEAELDLAQAVVVGKIVKLDPLDEKHGDYVQWSRATIEIRGTLKGKTAGTATCKVATHVDKPDGMASPPTIHALGEEGVWVIMPDGFVSHPHGFLDMGQAERVKEVLTDLDSRQWGEQVNGLRAWAGVVESHFLTKGDPVIILAIRNVSDKPIFCPSVRTCKPASPKTQPSETVARVTALLIPTIRADGKVFCQPIAPGQTMYLHPDDTCSFINLARSLPAGTYSVTVELSNTSNGFHEDNKSVEVWKGRLTAPPVTLLLTTPAPK